MEKVTKTFDEIAEFHNEAIDFIKKTEGNEKLKYALKKLVGDPNTSQKGSLIKAIKGNQIKARNLQIEYASTDPSTGILLKDEKDRYKYTKENQLLLMNTLDELSNEAVEIEPYYATEIDPSLDEYHQELFKGFVIQ